MARLGLCFIEAETLSKNQETNHSETVITNIKKNENNRLIKTN